MSNINLLCIEAFICLVMLLIVYRKWKIEGLYIYIIINFILSNIMSLKMIEIYNFDINLGIIPFATVFIASNIIIQKKGRDEIKQLVLILIGTTIVSYAILYLTKLMDSSTINLFTNKSYDNILNNSPRLYFANIVTMLYTLLINSKLYYSLKKIKNKIWISNLFTSIIIQFIASTAFPILAYALIKEPVEIVKLVIIRYMISLIVSIIGTFIIYIANKVKID